jgi:hypothetical protein
VTWRISIEDVSIQHACGVKERLQTDYVLYRGVAPLSPIQEPMRVNGTVVVYLYRIVGAYREVRIGIQKVDLLL